MPQALCGTVNPRVACPLRNGPPKGPVALRVSAMRHGATGTKRRPDTTVTEAFDVMPVPPAIEVTVTLLFFTPAVVPCTSTDAAQFAPVARVTPLRATWPAPAAAVNVPPQVLFRFGDGATVKPAGRLSVKVIPVRAVPV